MVANECDSEKLQIIQNTACHTILVVDKRTSISDMHASLNLLTLTNRRNLHFKTECYKNVHDNTSSLGSFFTLESEIRARQTRNTTSLSMHVLDLRTICGRKSFSYRGPLEWNGTKKERQQAESVHIFKSNLTKELCRDVNHPGWYVCPATYRLSLILNMRDSVHIFLFLPRHPYLHLFFWTYVTWGHDSCAWTCLGEGGGLPGGGGSASNSSSTYHTSIISYNSSLSLL